jgi:hypothetical protein
MVQRRSALLWIPWGVLAVSVVLLGCTLRSIGPDWFATLGLFLLICGAYGFGVTSSLVQRREREQLARNREESLKDTPGATGQEELLQSRDLRLDIRDTEAALSSAANADIGFVVGAHEAGALTIFARSGEDRGVLSMTCDSRSLWYHYGYKKRLRWGITDCREGSALIGAIEVRPAFLGRMRWRVFDEKNIQIGCLKAAVEWRNILQVLGLAAVEETCGALVKSGLAVIATKFGDSKKISGHSGSLWIGAKPICAMTWSDDAVALSFVGEEPTLYQRKIAASVAALLAYSPDYYKRA